MNCFVKESYGFIWHFCHNSHGICYCRMTDESITEYNVLIPDGMEDFDVAIDDSGCIHMVYQNKRGDILYANHFEDRWRKTTLLKSKSESCYPKDFVLKISDLRLDLLYCIEYNGRRMLIFQPIDNNQQSPCVIDCIKNQFCAVQDAQKNLVILYYSETQKSWGIKRFISIEREWTEFSAIDLGECNNPFLYIDSDDKIRIVFDRNSTVIEFSEGKERILGTGRRPIMFYKNDEFTVWEGVVDNKIYVKKAGDNAPAVIMSGEFSRPLRFKLRYTGFESGIRAECCTGNIINGSVRMYGINNFFAVSRVAPFTEERKNYKPDDKTYREMQKMKIRINQLDGLVEQLQKRLNEYDSIKTDRRLQELETAVNKTNKIKFLGLF